MSEPTRRDGAVSGHRHVGDGALGYDTGTARRGASVSRRRYVGTSTRPRLDASAPTCRYQVAKRRGTAASRYRHVGQDGRDRVPVDWEGTLHGRRGRDGRDRVPAERDGTLARPTGTGWTGSLIVSADWDGTLAQATGMRSNGLKWRCLGQGLPRGGCPPPDKGRPPTRGSLEQGRAVGSNNGVFSN